VLKAIAVYPCVSSAVILAVAGESSMWSTVPVATVRVTAGLVTPLRVAVISVVPAVREVAPPVEFIVATSVLELSQVTEWDTSLVPRL